MKIGALVKWSKEWIDGYDGSVYTPPEIQNIASQVGIVAKQSSTFDLCWIVIWSGGDIDECHPDYLEVICE